jgi:hypothetical protein
MKQKEKVEQFMSLMKKKNNARRLTQCGGHLQESKSMSKKRKLK